MRDTEHQKLIDICFDLVLTITSDPHVDIFKKKLTTMLLHFLLRMQMKPLIPS